MSITTSNLYSEPYSIVKSFLENITNLDPKRRFRTNIIHSSMPNVNKKGFSGYPFIILSIGIGETKPSFDIRVSEKIFRIMIGVWSKESTDVDSMSNKIFEAIQDQTQLREFEIITLDSSPFDWNMDRNGQKVCFRNINLVARQRI